MISTDALIMEEGEIEPQSPLSLSLPADLHLQITPAQFEKIAQINQELRLERTAAGELIVNPPTGWETGKRNFSLTGQLYRWCTENDQAGEAFDSSTGFILPNGAIRSPDISWVSNARWSALTDKQKGTFLQICPDFVVELRSTSDNLSPLREKMCEYLENGAVLGWLIDPKNRRVEIYRVHQAVEVLENPAELSGEETLPGLVINLLKIWEA